MCRLSFWDNYSLELHCGCEEVGGVAETIQNTRLWQQEHVSERRLTEGGDRRVVYVHAFFFLRTHITKHAARRKDGVPSHAISSACSLYSEKSIPSC